MTTKKWKLPPKFKFYEALGVLADNRMECETKNGVLCAKSYSSSRNKFYIVKYDKSRKQIMTNDNLTWYKDLLGYPALSLLIFCGEIKVDKDIIGFFKDIKFKDINQKYKNDFSKTKVEIDKLIKSRGGDLSYIENQIESMYSILESLNLETLGSKIKPPTGY